MASLRAPAAALVGAALAGVLAVAIYAASAAAMPDEKPDWIESLDRGQGTWVSNVGFAYDGTQPWTAPVRLVINGDRMLFNAGCNTMSGSVRIKEHRVYSQGLATTEMACDPTAMARDAWLAALVNDHATIQLGGSTDGEMLSFDTDAGWIGFIRAPAKPVATVGNPDAPVSSP